MADIGKSNILTVLEINDHGAYLDAEDLGAILLPYRYLPADISLGQQLAVFLYHDSEDRLVATTETPLAQVGEFHSLEVTAVTKVGAFLDWGLAKDLLVPFAEQKQRMQLGKKYLVRLYQDQHSQRIVASSKLDKFLNIWPADYQEGQQVQLTVATKTDLGFKAIINHLHWGLLYNNEIFKSLRTGQQIQGYIKKLRDDGHIDLSLSRAGRGKVQDFRSQFLQHLADNNGISTINDKSAPALIQKVFGVSKKTFKATVGHLLKQGKIELIENRIRLK